MGGGGAMRAAAKIAGIGARGFQAFSSSEIGFTAAARNSKPSVVSSSVNEPLTASVDGREIDDWDFAGGEEDDMFQVSGESKPRLVFGTVPTLQEAQVATSELKDALEKTYISSGWNSSLVSDKECVSQTKACVTSGLSPVLPKHATQALMFLNQSPVVQSVVSSIASDPNVWGAVMQNPELVGFLNSYNAGGGSLSEKEENVVDESSESGSRNWLSESGSRNWLSESYDNITTAVSEMIKNLSGYFQNLFGGPAESEKVKGVGVDMVMGGSFLELAVIVIMIVVLKRG